MSKTREEKRLELLERARSRIDMINNSCVFKADFESVRIMESMILEIKILAYENKSFRKLNSYNKLLLKKKDHKITVLEEKLNRT